jgi:UrcA family protein
MICPTLSALGLSAALVCAAPTLAQDRVSRHAGMTPASAAGAAAFERRLDLTAAKVCGRAPVRDADQTAIVSQCRREVLAGAQEMAGRVVAATRGPALATADQRVLAAVR